jgi:hypothetical protein
MCECETNWRICTLIAVARALAHMPTTTHEISLPKIFSRDPIHRTCRLESAKPHAPHELVYEVYSQSGSQYVISLGGRIRLLRKTRAARRTMPRCIGYSFCAHAPLVSICRRKITHRFSFRSHSKKVALPSYPRHGYSGNLKSDNWLN